MLGEPAVMTADPELIREIHAVNDPELFRSVLPEPAEVLLGSRSVLALSGEAHKHERKLLSPPFHGDRLRKWAKSIAMVGRRTFLAVGRSEFRALEVSETAAIEIIVRVIFGVSDESRIHRFVGAIREWTGAVRPSFVFARALQRSMLGLSPFARFMKISNRFDALLYEQIARARAHPGNDDVLGSMIAARYDDGSGMSDGAIRDELRTLLFAGHETSATTLAWALYFVHRDPQVLDKVLQELRTVDGEANPAALAELAYLGAVIDETLRIRPVVAENYRRLRKPWVLGKWSLPAGITVSPAVALVHHRPDLWPEPEAFRPERFLEGRPSPTIYFPFGGGQHRCIGAAFARFEACVLLGVVLQALELELRDEHVEWGRGRVTLEPLGGIRMIARGARASASLEPALNPSP